MSGKYENRSQIRRRKHVRKASVLIALLLVLVVGAGATFAYLMTQTESRTNTFIPGKITCQVDEDTRITVTDDSNVSGYIRAAILVNWMNEAGEVYAFAPVGYTITLGENWSQSGEYFYYAHPVAPGNSTSMLIESIALPANEENIPSGYELKVEVLAEAIQAVGNAGHNAADWGDAPSG